MNLQQKIERLKTIQKAHKKVMKETRVKLMDGAISMKEVDFCNQVVTVVIHNIDGKEIIKDFKGGPVNEHSERSARYHAEALGQGLIMVQRISGQISHMQVKP
jgi:plasmid replication initiation protein